MKELKQLIGNEEGSLMVIVLLMLVAWVIPARRAAVRADEEWARQMIQLNLIQSEAARGNLPSAPTLADRARNDSGVSGWKFAGLRSRSMS